ncbi:hypothetical protein F7Q99_21600 [Streptomyces kaniharaensis]|uniref:Uncharacterized protein n=1 Tax=Streptomyces kaniharaensis TaxID=212423 RepID=A0A6N7KVC8_9ACTN|nr:hypothetical protein [Streptomyces kaniharaensis]MQS14785.1 hypothetical protein [Streptomyces kaniharaensis]
MLSAARTGCCRTRYMTSAPVSAAKIQPALLETPSPRPAMWDVRPVEQDGGNDSPRKGSKGMTANGLRLPVEFLIAVAAGAEAGSAAARMAAEQARGLTDDRDHGRLLEALLAKPFREAAPAWLLEAAVTNGLRQAESEHLTDGTELVALALAHPECTERLRTSSLQRCTDSRLGSLGTAGRPPALLEAVVTELRRRMPQVPHITPDLIKEPTPAQVVLRTGRLHDDVFEAAVTLLPSAPSRKRLEDEDGVAWSKRIRAAHGAWERMWRVVLERHPERHAQLVETTADTAANHVVRDQLLGGIPWTVEPVLLTEIALSDLSLFSTAMLVTRLCRFLMNGESVEEARQHFATQLDALDDAGRREVELYLEEDKFEAKWGVDSAVSWVRYAAAGRWRLVLNPAEAKPSYGEPHHWLTPTDELAMLGRKFAETAVEALQTWQPDSSSGISRADELRWVHDMLIHLPEVTPPVKKTVQLMIRDAHRGQAAHRSYDFTAQEDRRQFGELLTTITRIVADPLPQHPVTRRAALGDPTQVTAQSLSMVASEVLDEYLDRHAGDDALVDKALLSFAWHRHYRPGPSFSEVLDRHSNPQEALRAITRNLRSRLGGNPANREAWAQQILALPGCPSDTILELPAWTALKTRGNRYDSAHPAVVDLVVSKLGDDERAWQRLANSPISYSGPNAWLRLGDILKAAADGTDWPKPPASR